MVLIAREVSAKYYSSVTFLTDKRILVTGGCGFLGSHFIRLVLERHQDTYVVNVDALTYAANRRNLEGIDEARYRLVEGDICDKELVAKLMNEADVVVNFASETHVDRSIHSTSDQFLRTNVVGVHSLLEALRNSPHIQTFVHVSSDEVWGSLPLESDEKFTENSPYNPSSPFAASKAAGDLLVRAYVKTHKLPVIVARSVNCFGPRQYPEKLFPFFTMRAIHNERLPLYGSGENMRDWLYVDDHSEAILTILEQGMPGEVYNISNGIEYSNKYVAEHILAALGKPASLIAYVDDRPAHDLKYAVDSSKLRGLGWKPRWSLTDKLKETVDWYATNYPQNVTNETSGTSGGAHP